MKDLYLILSVFLIFCLVPMPYGYYILVRFVAMVVFGVMTYQYIQKKQMVWAVTFSLPAFH